MTSDSDDLIPFPAPTGQCRAEFMEWVRDRGCDTDGAWSAWQAAWNRRSSSIPAGDVGKVDPDKVQEYADEATRRWNAARRLVDGQQASHHHWYEYHLAAVVWEAALASLRGAAVPEALTTPVDWLGRALALESQARIIESGTARQVMLDGARALRLMGGEQ